MEFVTRPVQELDKVHQNKHELVVTTSVVVKCTSLCQPLAIETNHLNWWLTILTVIHLHSSTHVYLILFSGYPPALLEWLLTITYSP